MASPGTLPSCAHDPNATKVLDFDRSSLAMCSCSLLRIEPLKNVTSM